MEQVVLNLLNMFGTGKDVDTGKAYVTFLGQESKKTVADIKTAFTELEQVGKYSGNGTSVNDKGGLLGAFLLGNANTDYNISGSLKADCNALTEYFRLIKSEGYDAKDALDLVKNTVPDVTESFEKFAKGIDVSGKSLTECITEFIPSFIKQVTHATTVTKILGNVIIGFGSALKSMAVAAGITLAITALGKAFGYLGTQLKEKIKWPDGSHFFYSMEEMTKNAKEAGAEFDNTASSIDSYKSKISELKESLDSGTLSESEAYDARKNLISIQDELVEKFGSEVNGLDLVNGSLETQIGLLDELSKTKARVWLNDPDNAKAIKQDQTQMSVNGIYDTDSSKYDLRASTSGEYGQEWKQIQDLAKKYGLNLSSAIDKDGNISFGIHLTADATSAEKTYSDFINDVSKNTLISDSLKDQLNSAVGDLTEKASGIISENSDLAEQAAKAQIQLNDTWSKTYSDLEEAQKTYNDAVAKNDDKAIAAALKKVKAAQDEFANTDIDNSFVQQYMQAQADQLDSATKLQAVQAGLSETFKGTTSNYKSLNDYLDVTDHKAEQLTDSITYNLNELKGLDDIDILNIGSLEKAGSASKNYTDEQIASYNRLKGVADQLGVSMDDLIDIFVKIGLVTSDNIKYTNEFTSSALTMATAASKAVSSVTSILNSQGTGVNVDTDSYSELIKDNAEYAAALQYSNGTMQLNREMAQQLTEAKVKESEAYIKVAYSQNQVKYEKVKNDLSYYTDEVRKSIEADADKLKQFDEEKAALESQSEALRDNCRSLQMQYSALMQASSAYQDWLNAQNATESGDMYDSAIEAKKALAEGLKNGKIGTVKWQAASEFLIPDDYEGTAAEYIKKLNRYFKQASDGSDDGFGINNFITDSLKAGLMKQESDGSIKILADKTTEDFAKALKLSPDAVQSIFGEMQEYGWTFDWGSMLGDPITNYKMQLDDIKDQMADLEPDSEAWQVLDARAEELESALDGLYQRSGLDQLADTVQQAKDNGVELSENVQQAADALDSAGRVQNELDIYDKQQEINEQQQNLTNTSDFENLAKLNQEMTELLQKRQQMGEPTDTEIELYLNQHADANGDIPSDVVEKMKNAGVIKVDTEADKSQLEQASDELDALNGKAKTPVKVTVNSSDAMTKISNLGTAIANLIKDYTINIKVNQSSSNSGSSGKNQKSTPYVAQYHGINGAYGGAFAGGRTLVGELGNELVVNPHSGKWYTVGDNGAEFVDLPKDAIVFDHSKTKKLLDQGFIGGRGVALASGTAMDSGSPGRGSYVGGNGYKVGQDPRVKSTYKATTASTKATKDNTTALEENKKALEKQKTALEKQKDALEKESNKLKIYGQAAINEIEKRITALNKEKDAQDKVYESQIKELEKRKTALQKANDEEDRAIKLAELQDALEKAKANRTVRIYNKNEGFVWRADQQAVSDAQNDLDDQKRQWKNDDILQAVDDEIERINNLKDAYDESVEAQIDDLDNMKEKWDEVISLIGTSWEDYQAQLAAAAEFNGMSLDGMAGAADTFKERVLANMKEIGENSDLIDQVTESIEALDEAISNSGGGSNDDASAGFGAEDGSDVEKNSVDPTSNPVSTGIDKRIANYKKLASEVEDAMEKLRGYKSEEQDLYEQLLDSNLVGIDRIKVINDYKDVQSKVAEQVDILKDKSTDYTNALMQEDEIVQSAKTSKVAALETVLATHVGTYDTMKSVLGEYATALIENTDLTKDEIQSSIDSFVGLSNQAGITKDDMLSILEECADATVSNTELTNEQRQSQMDSLVTLADQYGVNKDVILQHLIDVAAQEEISKTSTEETHQAMLETVQAACESMNVSYQSTINKINELTAAADAAIRKQKELAATRVDHNGGGGSKATQTVARYATGIIGAATTHIAITDEQGPEIKMRKPSAGNYSLIERGSSVIPAQPSANIWKMGIDPDSFISQHMPQRSIKSVDISTPDAGGVSVSVGDIQMYGVNDVESFGRVIHERVGTIFAQEFSRR